MDASGRLQELRRVELEMRALRRRLAALERLRGVLLELDSDEAPRRSVPSGAGLRALILRGADVDRPSSRP